MVLDVTEHGTTSRIVVYFSGTTIIFNAERDANSAGFAWIKNSMKPKLSCRSWARILIVFRQHTLVTYLHHANLFQK